MRIIYVGHSTVLPLTKGPRWFDYGYLKIISKIATDLRVLCPKLPPSFGEDVSSKLTAIYPDSHGFDYGYTSDFPEFMKEIPGYKDLFAYSNTYPLLYSLDMVYSSIRSNALKKLIQDFNPDVVLSCLLLDKEFYGVKKFIFLPIDFYPLASLEFFEAQGLAKSDLAISVIKKMQEFVFLKMKDVDGFISGAPNDPSSLSSLNKPFLSLRPTTDFMNTPYSPTNVIKIMYSGTYGWHRFLKGFAILKEWSETNAEILRELKIKFTIFCDGPIPEGEFFERQFRKIKGMDARECSFGIIPCEYYTGYPTKEMEYLANGLIPIRPNGSFEDFIRVVKNSTGNPRDFAKSRIDSELELLVRSLKDFLFQ